LGGEEEPQEENGRKTRKRNGGVRRLRTVVRGRGKEKKKRGLKGIQGKIETGKKRKKLVDEKTLGGEKG